MCEGSTYLMRMPVLENFTLDGLEPLRHYLKESKVTRGERPMSYSIVKASYYSDSVEVSVKFNQGA